MSRPTTIKLTYKKFIEELPHDTPPITHPRSIEHRLWLDTAPIYGTSYFSLRYNLWWVFNIERLLRPHALAGIMDLHIDTTISEQIAIQEEI